MILEVRLARAERRGAGEMNTTNNGLDGGITGGQRK